MADNTSGRSMWNGLASRYDGLYQSIWSQREDDEIAGWLMDALRSRLPLRILDIGCGTGLGYKLIRRVAPACEYVGIDIADNMIAEFKDKLAALGGDERAQLHVGDARVLADLFPQAQFDLVILLNATASYIGMPTTVLADSSRVLVRDGVLFASFLNRCSLRRCVRGRRGVTELYNTRGVGANLGGVPVILPSKAELQRRCSRLGLNTQWIKYQSVLGGVAELPWLLPVEAMSRRMFPHKGHTINLLATKLG
jgi:ubiquinone/menaquinone biosynthesis C-methylase UbiE